MQLISIKTYSNRPPLGFTKEFALCNKFFKVAPVTIQLSGLVRLHLSLVIEYLVGCFGTPYS